MRPKLGRLLLVLAIVAGLAGFALVLFTSSKPVPLPPLPSPNGYDDFLQAASQSPDDNREVNTLELSELRAFIATNTESLRLIRLGLSRTCSVPTGEALTNFANSPTQLMSTKKLARLLAAEGRLAEMQGRTNDAARIYVEGIRFGNESSRGGFIIHRMVGIACEAIACAPFARLVPSLNCEQARPLIAALEQADRTALTWDEVQNLERRFIRQEIRKTMNPLQWIVGWWQSREVIQRTEARHNRGAARVRLLMVELALRCYQSDQGQPPKQLAELVPKYLQRVPADPFSRQSLIYRSRGTNWLLYSIGPDGVDDGGVSAGRPVPGPGGVFKGDLFYYTP